MRERHVSRSSGMGPCLQEERQSCDGVHQELNIWDFSAFQEQAGLSLTCARAVSSCGFYSGHWRRGCDFSLLSVCSSLPLGTARQSEHCHSVSFPTLAKSNTVPNHAQKQGRWPFPGCPVHSCLSVSPFQQWGQQLLQC